MTRYYLCSVVLASVLSASASLAATRVERGNLIFDNIPEVPAEVTERLDAYLNAREATPLGFSPKGQLLIATRFADVNQLHVVERPGGERRQLSFLREPIDYAAFSPDPGRNDYLFQKDPSGSERTQVYYVAGAGDGAAKLLSDGKSMNGAAIWSNSGREIAFFSTARDGVSYDIDIVEPAAGTLPHLAVTGDNAGAWYPLDWSPDDRKLLVLKYVSIGEGYLYVVDLGTGQKREVDPAPNKVGIAGAKFSRDGQGVYLISDRDADFGKLRYVNLFTGEKVVMSAGGAGDVEDLAVSRDGHYLAYVSNDNGVSKLNLADLRSHQDLTAPKLPAPGVIEHLGFDAEGRRLAFGFTPANHPRDAYVLDLASNHVEAWTHSESGPLDSAKFVTPRLTQFPTFDRADGKPRQLPVYLYEPTKPGPHPALILLHGGPEAQFRPTFDPWIQYVVNELGFTVIAPNLRGSSGYGKAFLALDNGTLRDDVVKDMGALIVWVDLQSSIDSKRVAVAGASYGGYLALAALVNYGDRLMGGVDFAGINDFISYLTNTAPYRQTRRRAEFGDERDPDMRAFLRRISPLTNADRLTKPLLVVHGRNDPRVPVSESEQLVNRLRSRSGEVWFLEARDEGHEFRKKQNSDAYFATFAQFLKNLH
jgi:dipeptidyl aminopeptidase/acylaminoacyl peptidase